MLPVCPLLLEQYTVRVYLSDADKQEDITMSGNCFRHGGQNWFVADYPMVIA
jgi:hypothetical protein